MARAYPHLEMPKCILLFCDQSISELTDELQKLTDELDLIEELLRQFADQNNEGVNNLLTDRRLEISHRIEKATSEKTVWETIRKYQGRNCTACNGHGEVRLQYDQDDIRIETCKVCNGSGTSDNQDQ